VAKKSERSVWKGALAGLAAGLIASWAMDRFQDVWIAVSEKDKANEHSAPEEDNATVKAASAVSEGIFHHKLTAHEKQLAGPAVHYAVGGTGGLIYGIAAELMPQVTLGSGLPYGATFWLVVDEGLVPAFGLSKPASEYPLSTHVYALASHLVFGATTEILRQLLRD
jgi:putative membrane protein